MGNRKIAGALAVAALGALPVASASAHVTLQPKEVPAGSFKRLDVRVPNERDDAATTKVAVQFPDGFLSVSYEPVPGWTVKVVKSKLDKPVERHGEQITEQVSQVVFTADGRAGGIQPGQFRDFGLSVGLPDKPQTLTFKALQTYDDGDVVRWIDAPGADKPAPQVVLAAAARPAAAPASATADREDGDGGWNGLAIAALAVALVALATAGRAMRRPRSAT
jgi:uncharacterized protein